MLRSKMIKKYNNKNIEIIITIFLNKFEMLIF